MKIFDKIFDYKGWNFDDTLILLFDVTLKIEIQEYPIGYKFPGCSICMVDGSISFYSEVESKYPYRFLGDPLLIISFEISINLD